MSALHDEFKAWAWKQMGKDAGPEPVVLPYVDPYDGGETLLAVTQCPDDDLPTVLLCTVYVPDVNDYTTGRAREGGFLEHSHGIHVETVEQAKAVIAALKEVYSL